eukprot:scaffold65218_cov30-Tisochrysis_lutea.AAC.1
MERKEELQTPDIFWSREPITGPRGTKENPAIVPSYNDSRVVGLETESVCFYPRRRDSRQSGLRGSSGSASPRDPCTSSPTSTLSCTKSTAATTELTSNGFASGRSRRID